MARRALEDAAIVIVVAGRGVIAEALDGGWAAGLSGRHGDVDMSGDGGCRIGALGSGSWLW